MSDHQWTTSLYLDLQTDLKKFNAHPMLYVAFSGGVDSTVLLQAAVAAFGGSRVTAIHVHHGLSEYADEWQRQCESKCLALGCTFLTEKVIVTNQGQGIENEARRLRYDAFKRYLPEGAVLFLGQHLDDQVETFFLRLFRGAGIHGLKGMGATMNRDHYQIARPLLNFPKSALEAMAKSHNWTWITDDSNSGSEFDRNYLRNEVLPLIEARWPTYRDRIVQTQGLLDTYEGTGNGLDIQQELQTRLSHDGGLKMVRLELFSDAQCLSLLHAWLVSIGIQVPSRERLTTILQEVVRADSAGKPKVVIGTGSVRRHGPALYFVPELKPCGQPPLALLGQQEVWAGVGKVKLTAVQSDTPGLRADLPDLNWRLRAGGETIRPLGRSGSRDLKRLLQEYRIKPWLRDRTPLLFSRDELVAVGTELISAEHLAEKGDSRLFIEWETEIPD